MPTNVKAAQAEPKAAASPPPPLPPDLVKTLPAAKEIVKHLAAIERLAEDVEDQMKTAGRSSAIELARTFTVFHRLMTVVDAKIKPLVHLFEKYKVLEMPAAFERAGVTHVPLDAGYRVAVSYTMRASIREGEREGAYKWLGKNHPDCIVPTVNSSTLSRLARELLEDKNKELPAKWFNVANVPNTSVTRTQ